MTKKLRRRGAAGEGVVDTEQFAENVTPEEDDSYVVEDAATGGETTQKSVEITDDHEVVEHEETGSEEDFLAQEEGSEGAEEITEESREGRRGAKTTVTTDEDGNTEEVEIDADDEESEDKESEDEESEDEDETEREGSCRRGRRRGAAEAPESEDLIEEPVQPAPTGQGGKAPEHQTSIKSAVAFALKDRRL